MSPETLAMLRAYDMLLPHKFDLLTDAYKKHTDTMEEKASVPTVSFKDKKLKSVKENSTTLLTFFINGEYVRLGGTKYDIQLTCDSKSVTFSTTSWSEMEEGFTIKTKITTKDPEVINIAFKFDGKESNSLNLAIAATQVEKPEKCICKKTSYTIKDLQYIVTQLRKLDTWPLNNIAKHPITNHKIWLDKEGNEIEDTDTGKRPKNGVKEKRIIEYQTFFNEIAEDREKNGDRLFMKKASDLNVRKQEAVYSEFTKQINNTLIRYDIKSCIRKVHFFAQIYHETQKLTTTYEANPSSSVSGGDYYRGRGLAHLTHDYNYLRYYDYRHATKFYETYILKRKSEGESVIKFNSRTENKYISVEQMEKIDELVRLVSVDLFFACDTAGWYWMINEINKYADQDDLIGVSAKINNPSAKDLTTTSGINGYDERKKYYDLMKVIFDYENCK